LKQKLFKSDTSACGDRSIESSSMTESGNTSISSSVLEKRKTATSSSRHFARASIHAPAVNVDGELTENKSETREALKVLLDRNPRPLPQDAGEAMPPFASMFGAKESVVDTFAVADGPEDIPADLTLASVMEHSALPSEESEEDDESSRIDRMLGEILGNKPRR
jgi:hypothetical protein